MLVRPVGSAIWYYYEVNIPQLTFMVVSERGGDNASASAYRNKASIFIRLKWRLYVTRFFWHIVDARQEDRTTIECKGI